MPTTFATSPALHQVTVMDLITECTIALRTVDQITSDLDHFSRRLRIATRNPTVIADAERHLAQARRNCAEATILATAIHDIATTGALSPTALEEHEARLRDAFALLALADSAFLRAFDVAGEK